MFDHQRFAHAALAAVHFVSSVVLVLDVSQLMHAASVLLIALVYLAMAVPRRAFGGLVAAAKAWMAGRRRP